MGIYVYLQLIHFGAVQNYSKASPVKFLKKKGCVLDPEPESRRGMTWDQAEEILNLNLDPNPWVRTARPLLSHLLGHQLLMPWEGCDLGKSSFTWGSPEGAESESGLLASLPTAGQQESSSLFTDSSDFHGYRKHMRTWVLCLRGQQITQHHPGAVMDFIVFLETSNEFLGSLSSLIPISFPVWKKKWWLEDNPFMEELNKNLY